jgi:hypothetical protein
MKPVARFVTRCDGTMFIGTMFKDQTSLLPDHVYEIQSICGVMVIVDKGLSVVPEAQNIIQPDKVYGSGCWGNEFSHVINCFGKTLFINAEEYKQLEVEK